MNARSMINICVSMIKDIFLCVQGAVGGLKSPKILDNASDSNLRCVIKGLQWTVGQARAIRKP